MCARHVLGGQVRGRWYVLRSTRWRGVESVGGSDRTQIWVRRRALRLSHRAWRFGAAPGPTNPIASEEGRSPWSGVRHGCPRHSLRAYVRVHVSGTCSTVRVQENVGGGGRLQVVWMNASSEASIFTKRKLEPTMRTTPNPIHSERGPTYALDESTHKFHVQRWLVAVAMRADAEIKRHLEINSLRGDNRMRLNRVHRDARTNCVESDVLLDPKIPGVVLMRMSLQISART